MHTHNTGQRTALRTVAAAGALLAAAAVSMVCASSAAAQTNGSSHGLHARAATPQNSSRAPERDSVRFEMHEYVNHASESYTFTTDVGPLCPAGTFADHVTVVSSNANGTVVHWLVDTTYTCADGSGTFTAVKDLVRHQYPDRAWNVGQVVYTGGTGRYANLTGHGHDWGASANGQGAGVTHGRVELDGSDD